MKHALALASLGFLLAACSSTAAPELPDRASAAFERQDRNADGVITEAEVRAGAEARFAELDADRSNRLSWAEFRDAPQPARGRRAGSQGEVFARLDRDGDGSLSRDEYADQALRLFDAQDRTRDGRVTRAELAEAMAERRERRPDRPR